MRKYIIEIDIPNENEVHVIEVSKTKLKSLARPGQIKEMLNALENAHEVRLKATSSKKLGKIMRIRGGE